jgi:hypothetical protein
MKKHRASAILLSLSCMVLGGCKQASDRESGRVRQDPVAVARSYSLAHLALFPSGTGPSDLLYDINEQGDHWVVEISPRGYMGGGLRLLVSKGTSSIIDVKRTQ